MSELPAFTEIRDVVKNEVIDATNAYTLLTQLAFPLRNQLLLHQHYPYLIDNLVIALTGQVLMTVYRLFDPDEDPRHASLTTFLKGIEPYHAKDKNVAARLVVWRDEFSQRIPAYLTDIKTRWKVLVQHRSAHLAHRDLSKRNLPPVTYSYFRECFEQAQRVIGGYLTAYEDTTQFFDIAGVKDDPERFMRWCRLDNYERHFKEDMQRRKKKLLDEIGERRVKQSRPKRANERRSPLASLAPHQPSSQP
jgi:hypothetical protein